MAVLIQYANGAPGIKFDIDKPVFRIGRGMENDLCIPDGFVSKEHAIIERRPLENGDGFEYFILDLKSTNKTYVNESQVQRFRLNDEDMVKIGKNSFKFVLGTETLSMDDTVEDEPPTEQKEILASGRHAFSRRLQFHHY